MSVKEKFPRLFAISLLKNKKVAKCGAWEEEVWAWKLI